ncbi:MAG TPA: response regulator [Polyangia bacterium]|jgi:twitching motility two-component system response regulator PilH
MKTKILVVDDEPDVVRYFTALLEENGYATMSAKDGAEALATVRRERPALVTLDITMPNQSGVRVFRELKEDAALRGIPVVVVTGISHDFKNFISTRPQVPPPDGYLEKPVTPEALLGEVRRLLT